MEESSKSTEKHKEQKPKDDPESFYRTCSVLSYFMVLVVIGIPVWWYTTRVYRASLPLDQMFDYKLKETTGKDLGIPLSLEYDVLVTIVNPEPENLKIDIDGEDIERHLSPFLKHLSPIADFVVKSQWLFLVGIGANPRRINDEYVLLEEQLPHIITPLETKLWSHLSKRPCLNLVLYIPHCAAPLHIYDKNMVKSQTNAFLSPRWGGIHILNPDQEACSQKLFKPALKPIISTFVAQLKEMFHIKDTKETSLNELKTRKAVDMIDSSRRTLKSLAQLLSEISNIVISDDVASKINFAVENADAADHHLRNLRIEEGLKHAKIAFNNSESAFSDPSLLALLYFPDDQKYAVYIPLFLPVMIPVLMSLTTIAKKFVDKKKIKTELKKTL